jgi:hypothetical protein
VRKPAWVLVAVAAGGAGWAIAELARPRRTDIRVFDPDAVARLETAMLFLSDDQAVNCCAFRVE